MSDEEEFDSEKTQFWLPGQALPGRPAAGDADGDQEGVNLAKSTQGAERKPGSPVNAGEIDFDLTAEVQAGSSSGLDFDLSAEADASTMDFDITGEGTVPPELKAEPPEKASTPAPAPAATAKPVHAPAPPASTSGSGGALLLVAAVAIAAVVIYFVTR